MWGVFLCKVLLCQNKKQAYLIALKFEIMLSKIANDHSYRLTCFESLLKSEKFVLACSSKNFKSWFF